MALPDLQNKDMRKPPEVSVENLRPSVEDQAPTGTTYDDVKTVTVQQSEMNPRGELIEKYNTPRGETTPSTQTGTTPGTQVGTGGIITTAPPGPAVIPPDYTNIAGVTQSTDYQQMRDQLTNNMTNPTLPPGTAQEAVKIEGQAGEFIDPNKYNIAQQPEVDTATYTAAQSRLLTAEEAQNEELKKQGFISPATAAAYQAAQAEFTIVANAVKGRVSNLATGVTASAAMAEAAYQDLDKVDPKTIAKALTHEVPNEATVKGQLDGLLQGLETGKIPEWAKPAVAQAEAMLAARGLSTSSVGRNALFNSIITAAMPIAQADAAAKLSVFQQDITNEQQAILANSQFFQTLTVKNLDNRQQAAIVNATNATNANIASAQNMTQASIANAQAFLQMDLANLNNAQQAQMATAQFRQQTLLSNQAAENTARQFNAANEQQASQFNTNLAASISQFNSTQLNAAAQFNAGAENAMSQFNSQLNFQREQFNMQNAAAIEQSNVQWRRQMNQINTASENAVNQANAMNLFNMSNQALTFLWQEQRDAAAWANAANQNALEQQTRLAIAALGNEAAADQNSLNNIKALASAAISLFDNWGTKKG